MDEIDTVTDIAIRLYDKDDGTEDDFLGECTIPSSVVKRAATSGEDQDFWKFLEKISAGSVRTRISWSPLSLVPANGPDDQAVLVVFLDSCRNIMKVGEGRTDYVVSASVGVNTKLSQKSKGSIDPIFEERMVFIVDYPETDYLKLNIIDTGSDKPAGCVTINISDLRDRESFSIVNQKWTFFFEMSIL